MNGTSCPETAPRPAEYWGSDDDERLDCTDRDEYVERYLDSISHGHLPATFTVTGFARMQPNWDRELSCTLESLDERLSEEFGDPEGFLEAWTPEIDEAWKVFCAAMKTHYRVWACEPVCEEVVDVKAWVMENCPHWDVTHEADVV